MLRIFVHSVDEAHQDDSGRPLGMVYEEGPGYEYSWENFVTGAKATGYPGYPTVIDALLDLLEDLDL